MMGRKCHKMTFEEKKSSLDIIVSKRSGLKYTIEAFFQTVNLLILFSQTRILVNLTTWRSFRLHIEFSLISKLQSRIQDVS